MAIQEDVFPQANNVDRLLSLINIPSVDDMKDVNKVSMIIGNLTTRQGAYYTSALLYLGIINNDKTFTPLGLSLRELVGVTQKAELARLIISLKPFGTVYFREKLLGFELNIEDIIDIMKEQVDLEEESVYRRRASTIKSWVKWICDQEQ